MTEPPSPVRERSTRLIDPDLVEASRMLHGALVRVHPSFRFEERLASRLADEAAAVLPAASAWARRTVAPPVQFPDARVVQDATVAPQQRPAVLTLPHLGDLLPHGGARRAFIGGAIASGVSLAGAALLARRWRAGRDGQRRADQAQREGVA